MRCIMIWFSIKYNTQIYVINLRFFWHHLIPGRIRIEVITLLNIFLKMWNPGKSQQNIRPLLPY